MLKLFKKRWAFDFGDNPEAIEANRQIFLIRFFAVVGSMFLIPLGIYSLIENRHLLGIVLILAAILFTTILYFTKSSRYLVFLRSTYCALLSLLTIYLILGGGALGTGIYYAFSLCLLIISYAGHRHGIWVSACILMLLSTGLYSDFSWLYPYEPSHRLRIILGVSLVFMMMLIFEWMRMHSYQAIRIQSEDYKQNAMTDPLTGLFNRVGLDLHLREWKDNQFPGCLVMIDIDHFKLINDNYGHHAGDLALVSLARVIREHVKGKDLVARWGGEEFILIFSKSDRSDIVKVLEDIRDTLKMNAIKYGKDEFYITFSAGVSSIHQATHFVSCQIKADELLYIAKSTGRDKTVVF